MSDEAFISEAVRRLSHELRENRDASGNNLHRLIDSVEDDLSESDRKTLRFVATMQKKVSRDGQSLTMSQRQNVSRFADTFCSPVYSSGSRSVSEPSGSQGLFGCLTATALAAAVLYAAWHGAAAVKTVFTLKSLWLFFVGSLYIWLPLALILSLFKK